MLGWSRRFPHFMEPQCITVLTKARHCPYPQPYVSSPHTCILFIEDPFQYYPLTYVNISQVFYSLQFSSLRFVVCISHLSHASYTPHLSPNHNMFL
jgi:hypothetical protein